MRRDDRPYFDEELGIPWDEMQFATWLMVEGGVKQMAHGVVDQLELWVKYWDIDGRAAEFARASSKKLRNHPSHHVLAWMTDGEPILRGPCGECGASYRPGGGWEHRFIHCTVRLTQVRVRRDTRG